MRLVLDADVVIGALDSGDAHHIRARELFESWTADDADLLISVVNLSEVLVLPSRDHAQLRAARGALATLAVKPHHGTEAIAITAARYRAAHPISLADAYCLATAEHAGAAVASFDERLVRAAAAEGIPAIKAAGG